MRPSRVFAPCSHYRQRRFPDGRELAIGGESKSPEQEAATKRMCNEAGSRNGKGRGYRMDYDICAGIKGIQT